MVFQLDIEDGANFVVAKAIAETAVMILPITEMVTIEKPFGVIGKQCNTGHEGRCQAGAGGDQGTSGLDRIGLS
jgi:hypothetical protein